jgi:hypothetical protein
MSCLFFLDTIGFDWRRHGGNFLSYRKSAAWAGWVIPAGLKTYVMKADGSALRRLTFPAAP